MMVFIKCQSATKCQTKETNRSALQCCTLIMYEAARREEWRERAKILGNGKGTPEHFVNQEKFQPNYRGIEVLGSPKEEQ